MQQDFGNLESPLSGSEFINGKLEPWRDTLHSYHSGDTRPSYAVPGMIWIDTTTDPWVINIFGGSDDVSIGTVDLATGIFTASNTSGGSTSVDITGFSYLTGQTVQTAMAEIDAALAALGDLANKDKVQAGDVDSQTATNGHILSANGSGGAAWIPNPSGVIATQAEAEAGTENTKIMTALRTAQAIEKQKLTQSTAVATTSGTSVVLTTNIPSTAKRICVILDSVSTNGASTVIIQLGNGSFVTTGYINPTANIYATNAAVLTAYTNGFGTPGASASTARAGILFLEKISGNKWVASGNIGDNAGAVLMMTGVVTLSGALDRVRLTTSGGTDTFDAGSASVSWE